jgi:hypothetical protein
LQIEEISCRAAIKDETGVGDGSLVLLDSGKILLQNSPPLAKLYV